MAPKDLLSLLSAAAMAFGFRSGAKRLDGNAGFVLQIIGYLLLGASSWLAGGFSAALVLAMCAATLLLKMLRRFPPRVMAAFLAATLIGGILVNNRGWAGLLPVAAGAGVVFRHAYVYRFHLPLRFFSKEVRENVRRQSLIVLSRMDNANRMYGQAHALDLFLENIVGVALWAGYAWIAGDIPTLVWRGVMLALNLCDGARRIWPVVYDALDDILPSPGRSRRKRKPGMRRDGGRWMV